MGRRIISGRQRNRRLEFTGTTTNSYVTQVDLDLRDALGFLAMVMNTHAANSMDVDVYTRTDYDDPDTEEQLSDFPLAIAGGGTNYGNIHLNKKYERVLIKVKATSGGSQATFKIVWNKQL